MKLITHDDYVRKLSPTRQKKIAACTRELLTEEMTLKELRKARKQSQTEIAEMLGVGQGDVSKLERRTDAYMSTVRCYVEAMGGRLDLIAQFPNLQPVKITSIGEL